MKASVFSTNKLQSNGKTHKYLYVRYTSNGKRKTEPVKDYLIEPATTSSERQHNREAQKKLEALQQMIQHDLDNSGGNYIPALNPHKQNLLDMYDQWLKRCLDVGVKQQTVTNYKQAKNLLIKFSGENISVADVDVDYLVKFQSFLSKFQSHNTVSRHINTLSILFNYLHTENMIEINPFPRFNNKKGNEKRLYATYDKQINQELKSKIVLSSDELKQCWDALQVLQHKTGKLETRIRKDDLDTNLAFLFSSVTGLRYSDVSIIKPSQIHSIDVDGTQRFYLEFIQVKTGVLCQSPLNATALMILNEVQKQNTQYQHQCFRCCYQGRSVDRLLRAANITKTWKQKGESLPAKLSFKDSRTTFLSNLRIQGVDDWTRNKLKGAKIKDTDILDANYTEVDIESNPKLFFDAVDKLNWL